MGYEEFVTILSHLVSRYIAVFCLASILCWAVGSYFLRPQWRRVVRDGAIYFFSIGILAGFLALNPLGSDIFFWAPLAWFSFSMLMIMELFWISYLLESLISYISHISLHKMPQQPISSMRTGRLSDTPYARK